MNMLPVGHTHEDIDARFPLVSRSLFQNDASETGRIYLKNEI